MNVGGEGDDVLEYTVIEILGFIANNSNKKALNIQVNFKFSFTVDIANINYNRSYFRYLHVFFV